MENYKIKMMNNSIYHYPTINLLDSASAIAQDVDLEQLEEQQKHIIDVLRTFCIPINEIKYTLSPSAIRYEIKPKSGQLYAKVRKNEHDIIMSFSYGCSNNVTSPRTERHGNRNCKSSTIYIPIERYH